MPAVWPILINTIDGVRHIESILVDTGRTFGLSAPANTVANYSAGAPRLTSSPVCASACRSRLILVTTAEMIAGSKGLGFFILDEERSMNSSNMYAGILLVAALGYALNRLFLVVGSEDDEMAPRHDGAGIGLRCAAETERSCCFSVGLIGRWEIVAAGANGSIR